MAKKVFLNGSIIPADEAKISVSDVGFLHGASSFTTMLAHNGKVFRLDRHLRRLLDTVDMLMLKTDATAESLTEATYEVLKANSLKESRVRITLTPGSIQGDKPTTLITAEPLGEYPSQWYEEGITVIVSSFTQPLGDITAGFKTGCYMPRVLARQEAANKGAEEALWYTADKRLSEACFCNVFLVLDGNVYTPPLDTPVLGGIVREAVIELCQKLGIECFRDKPLTVKEMLAAEEVFITSSCSGIRPVARIERHGVGDEKPGNVTKQLMQAYRELLDSECPA